MSAEPASERSISAMLCDTAGSSSTNKMRICYGSSSKREEKVNAQVFFDQVTSKLAVNQFRALLLGTVEDPGKSDAESERMAHWQDQS
jgi:hypothetical protein